MRVVGTAGIVAAAIERAVLLVAAATACACGGPPSPTPAPPSAAGENPPAEDVCAERGGVDDHYVIVKPGQRHEPAAERFSELATGPDRPIEVCTFEAQYRYLANLRCDDGSKPFDSLEAARSARVGPISNAGRCGNIVDRYEVECPEGSHSIYIDLYMCERAELPEAPGALAVTDRAIALRVPSGWRFALDAPDGIAALVRGPERLRVAIARAQGGAVSLAELGPIFDSLGEARPSRIERRSELSRGELLLLDRRDAVAFAVAEAGDPKISWIGAVFGAPESLLEHGATAHEIVASARSTDHDYLDYGELVFDDVEAAAVVLDEVDGKQVLMPAGWTNLGDQGAVVSRPVSSSGGSISLVQSPLGEAGANSRDIGNKIFQNLIRARPAVTIAYSAFDAQENLFRVVLDLGSELRAVLVVRRNQRGGYDYVSLLGPPHLLREHKAYVIVEAIVSFELPDGD